MVTGADGAVCQVIGGVGLERGESLGSGGELGALWERVLGHVQLCIPSGEAKEEEEGCGEAVVE